MSTRKSIIITKKKHGRLKNEENSNNEPESTERDNKLTEIENEPENEPDLIFNDFLTKLVSSTNSQTILQNHLLKYRKILDSLMGGEEGDGSATTNPQLNRHYDVKNDINLINLSSINIDDDTEINENVSQILSDPGFVSQVIHKTQTLNKYNIIIQDPCGTDDLNEIDDS